LVITSCVSSPNVTKPTYEKPTLKTAAARCVQSSIAPKLDRSTMLPSIDGRKICDV